MTSRIYIVEDNEIMREMLSQFIDTLPDMEVCGAAESAEEALAEIGGLAPNVVLVDMALPEMNGAELIGLLRERRPELPCLVLSGHGEAAYVARAFAAGARGYVAKGNPYELPDAIRKVLGGDEYLSDSLRRPGA